MTSPFGRSAVTSLLLGAIVTAGLSAQRTWVVDQNNGPGSHFATIQAAIDASSDGDTINVGAGTYTNGAGNCFGPQQYALSIEKEISLVGAGADYDPAVGSVFAPYSCGGQASNGVVYIAADNVTVSGLALEGQTNLDSASGQSGELQASTGPHTRMRRSPWTASSARISVDWPPRPMRLKKRTK